MSNKRKDIVMAVLSGAKTRSEIMAVAGVSHVHLKRVERLGLIRYEPGSLPVMVFVTPNGMDCLELPDVPPPVRRQSNIKRLRKLHGASSVFAYAQKGWA